MLKGALPHPEPRPPPPRPSGLTLVLDDTVSRQQLQRVHLKEHAVEEEVVGGRPLAGVPCQAGEDELLGVWRGEAKEGAQ